MIYVKTEQNPLRENGIFISLFTTACLQQHPAYFVVMDY
jgi:hypothetical protein